MEISRSSPPVSYDTATDTVVIHQLGITDDVVTREARRWTAGERGEECVDVDELAVADLTPFVTRALTLGALAIGAVGAAQDRFGVERLLKDVGERASESSTRAAEVTTRAAQEASEIVTNASEHARKSIVDAETEHRKHLATTVNAAKSELTSEITRLFGGESPELLDRLRPILDRFESGLDAKVGKQTEELLAKAARLFDPSDPTSPMARHAAGLAAEQKQLAEALSKHHGALAAKVDELTTAVRVQVATQEARSRIVNVTPIKGDDFETHMNVVLAGIATGLGDDFADTRRVVGAIPRCSKGDALFTIDAGSARLLVEMTNSARRDWTGYLEEAERNREAAASLGLVRTTDQNLGQAVRVLGPRRIVMAFDPENDDIDLLRTVVMLLRTAAITSSSRRGAEEIATAEEKVTEALEHLDKIASVKKLAGTIAKNAGKIDTECDGLGIAIRRLLNQALTALSGGDGAPDRTSHQATDGAA